jgi:hypothetical protein
MTVANFPGPHDKQVLSAVAPISAEYFPAVHPSHVPPTGPYEPALHLQALADEEAAGELERSLQSWQDVAVALNLPAPHMLHTWPAKSVEEI